MDACVVLVHILYEHEVKNVTTTTITKPAKKKMSFGEHEVTIKCITVCKSLYRDESIDRHSCANVTECVSLLSKLHYLSTTMINDELAFYALYLYNYTVIYDTEKR